MSNLLSALNIKYLRGTLGLLLSLIAVTISFSLYSPAALAADKTWLGTTDAQWLTASNWSPAGAPANFDHLIFPVLASNKTSHDDLGYRHDISITFDGSGYVIDGSQMNVTSLVADHPTAGTNTIYNDLLLSVSTTDFITNHFDTLVLAGQINLNSNTLDFNDYGVVDVTGNISGSGSASGISKVSSGNLIFEHDNTYEGLTSILSGRLTIKSNNGLGVGTPTDTLGTTVGNGGQLYVDATAGPLTIAAENLTLNGNGTLPNIGALYTDGVVFWTNPINIATDSTMNINGNEFLTQVFTGSAALTKMGPATWQVENDSPAYTGQINLNDGQTNLSTNLGLGASGSANGTTINDGAILVFGLDHLTVPEPLTFTTAGVLFPTIDNIQSNTTLSGQITLPALGEKAVFNSSGVLTISGKITGLGDLYKDDLGTVILNNNLNDYTGSTTVNRGILKLLRPNALGAAGTVANGTTVNSDGSLEMAPPAGNMTILDENLVLNGTGSVFNGVGALVGMGTATDTWSGPITLATDATIEANNPAGTISTEVAVISGPGALNKTGPGLMVLSGANTYTGATNIFAGTLRLNNGPNIVIPDGSAVTVAAGATLNLTHHSETIGSLSGAGNVILADVLNFAVLTTGGDNSDTTFSGIISGEGGRLVNVGTGKMTLTGNNTYTGTTTINGGTLFVNGSQSSSDVTVSGASSILGGSGTVGQVDVTGNGTVSPGNSPGIINTSDLSLPALANLRIEINGAAPGTGYDQVNVTGTANIDLSTLILTIAPAFTPAIGQNFTIIQSSGALTGIFTGLPNNHLINLGGKYLVIKYNPNSVILVGADSTGNIIPPAPPTPPSGGGSSGFSEGGGCAIPTNCPMENPPSSNSPSSTPKANPVPAATPATQPATTTVHPAAEKVPTHQHFFTDIDNDQHSQEIDEIFDSCKVSGYEDQKGNFLQLFRPSNQITRAELFAMIVKCKVGVLDAPSSAPFPDVPANHWAAPYIAKGLELGLLKGYDDGFFRPNQTISKAEALKAVLLSWFTLSEINNASKNASCSDISSQAWYAQYFYFALNNSLINDTICQPNNEMTRSDSAAVIVKVRRKAMPATN